MIDCRIGGMVLANSTNFPVHQNYHFTTEKLKLGYYFNSTKTTPIHQSARNENQAIDHAQEMNGEVPEEI